MTIKIIMDTDPGIDDAAALTMALNDPEIDVKLITSVAGNVTVDKTTKNAQKIVRFFNKQVPGTSDKAGACFVGSATQSGKHRIITVVLGARNKGASDPARFIQTAKLMRSVYTTQHPIKLKANTAIKGVGKAKVPDGKQETVLPGYVNYTITSNGQGYFILRFIK